MTLEEKAKAYDEAIQRAKEILEIGVKDSRDKRVILSFFPELKESEDERTRKELVSHFREMRFVTKEGAERAARWIAWIEKQGKQFKKVSIWKHWKDGIAGNGNGDPVYLIKDCSTYSLSSVLSFECDYIELSELNNLMLEKQGQQKSSSPNELKFGVGDIVKSKSQPMLKPMEIKSIGEDCYYCEGGNLIGFAWEDDYEIVEQKELSQSQVTKTSDKEWSEEDEDEFQIIQKIICDSDTSSTLANRLSNWLKSLKQRLQINENEQR